MAKSSLESGPAVRGKWGVIFCLRLGGERLAMVSLARSRRDWTGKRPWAARLGPRRELRNRRKWCALNPRSAHNLGSVVRVGALGNKGAHCELGLVRTGWFTVRGLTSTGGPATGEICRVRRGSAIAVAGDVRILAHCRALGRVSERARRAVNAHYGARKCGQVAGGAQQVGSRRFCRRGRPTFA